MRVLADDITNGKGQLTGHTLETNTNNHYGIESIFYILQILYLNDGAFIFICREDMIKGTKTINQQFKKFGMEMHVEQNKKEEGI